MTLEVSSVTEAQMRHLLCQPSSSLSHIKLKTVHLLSAASVTLNIPEYNALRNIEVCNTKPQGSRIVLNLPRRDEGWRQLQVSGCTLTMR